MAAAPTPLSQDTTLVAEAAWLAALRAKGAAWRFEQALAWSAEVRRMALDAFDRVRPGATARERREWMLRQCYRDDVADRYVALRWP